MEGRVGGSLKVRKIERKEVRSSESEVARMR